MFIFILYLFSSSVDSAWCDCHLRCPGSPQPKGSPMIQLGQSDVSSWILRMTKRLHVFKTDSSLQHSPEALLLSVLLEIFYCLSLPILILRFSLLFCKLPLYSSNKFLFYLKCGFLCCSWSIQTDIYNFIIILNLIFLSGLHYGFLSKRPFSLLIAAADVVPKTSRVKNFNHWNDRILQLEDWKGNMKTVNLAS